MVGREGDQETERNGSIQSQKIEVGKYVWHLRTSI